MTMSVPMDEDPKPVEDDTVPAPEETEEDEATDEEEAPPEPGSVGILRRDVEDDDGSQT